MRKDLDDAGVCDFCGKRNDPYKTLKLFWNDKTREFCGIGCLNGFKAASFMVNEDAVFDGPPGTAKLLLKQLEQHKKDCHGQ